MRAALIPLLLAPAIATAGVPVALSERQVLTLEFSRPVQRLAVSDPEPLALAARGASVRITAQRPGRVQLDVVFDDGATASYDVRIEPLQASAARPVAPDELELQVGQERVVPAPAGAQVLLEETGVARASVEPRGIVVRGVAPGPGSLVVIDPAGGRTTWRLRVR